MPAGRAAPALLGAHVSTAGGLHKAPGHGQAIDAQAIQIFTRNQVQWRARPIAGDEALAFRDALARSGLRLVVAHGSYLVNLASPQAELRNRSRAAFLADMRRCHALGVPYLIFHPGAHMGAGEEAGLRAVARSLDYVLKRAAGLAVRPLIEVTAGQGTCVGHRFEHLERILELCAHRERLGVCLDTCHLYAAGYDIATEDGYEATLAELDRRIGLAQVRAIHLNDAKRGLGSRLDRHARIGEGCLGLPFFSRLLRDRRFGGRPMVLETPGPLESWKREIALLRELQA